MRGQGLNIDYQNNWYHIPKIWSQPFLRYLSGYLSTFFSFNIHGNFHFSNHVFSSVHSPIHSLTHSHTQSSSQSLNRCLIPSLTHMVDQETTLCHVAGLHISHDLLIFRRVISYNISLDMLYSWKYISVHMQLSCSFIITWPNVCNMNARLYTMISWIPMLKA